MCPQLWKQFILFISREPVYRVKNPQFWVSATPHKESWIRPWNNYTLRNTYLQVAPSQNILLHGFWFNIYHIDMILCITCTSIHCIWSLRSMWSLGGSDLGQCVLLVPIWLWYISWLTWWEWCRRIVWQIGRNTRTTAPPNPEKYKPFINYITILHIKMKWVEDTQCLTPIEFIKYMYLTPMSNSPKCILLK